MTSSIAKIRSRNQKSVASTSQPPVASAANHTALAVTVDAGVRREPSRAAADPPPDHPPPTACPFCDCPAVWISIYDVTEVRGTMTATALADAYRCCDCDPPPGGWHWLTGGWSFVARRLLLVLDADRFGAERWHWESFPRIDWRRF